MKSANIRPTNQPLIDMEPRDIFRRLAQLQPHHKRVWERSFKYWMRKKAAATTATG